MLQLNPSFHLSLSRFHSFSFSFRLFFLFRSLSLFLSLSLISSLSLAPCRSLFLTLSFTLFFSGLREAARVHGMFIRESRTWALSVLQREAVCCRVLQQNDSIFKRIWLLYGRKVTLYYEFSHAWANFWYEFKEQSRVISPIEYVSSAGASCYHNYK